jgi:hypothetical protein
MNYVNMVPVQIHDDLPCDSAMIDYSGLESSCQLLPTKHIIRTLSEIIYIMYQYGDGYGNPDRETKDRVLSLLVIPIPLHRDQHD